MRVVLEEKLSANQRRKIWLANGQTVRIGRTEAADVVVPDDPQMSGVHFAVECRSDKCRIRDLGSTNGTFVNGVKFEESILKDGDEIRAGQTTFRCVIEDDSPAAETTDGAATPRLEEEAIHLLDTPRKAVEVEQAAETPSPDQTPGATRLEQVVLTIHEGPYQGRKLWLGPGETLSVGRTDESDLVIPRDGELSGRHFVLESDAKCCRIRDLKSRNGVFLNGARISQAILCDRDEIRAGGTTFVVQMRGGIPAATRTLEEVPQEHGPNSSAGLDAAQVKLQPLPKPYTYKEFRCRSGLSLFHGCQCRFDAATIADRLSHVASMYVIVDPARLGEVSPDLPEATFLFAWLPEDQARQSSPVGIWPSDESDLSKLVEDAWSHDGLICVYSRQETQQLTEHLCDFAREHAENPATEELGHFRPTAVAEFLANGNPESVTDLFRGLDAVFMEIHGGNRWAVFSAAGLAPILQKIGLAPVSEWEL